MCREDETEAKITCVATPEGTQADDMEARRFGRNELWQSELLEGGPEHEGSESG